MVEVLRNGTTHSDDATLVERADTTRESVLAGPSNVVPSTPKVKNTTRTTIYLDDAVEPITEATGSTENDTDGKKKTGKKQKVGKQNNIETFRKITFLQNYLSLKIVKNSTKIKLKIKNLKPKL